MIMHFDVNPSKPEFGILRRPAGDWFKFDRVLTVGKHVFDEFGLPKIMKWSGITSSWTGYYIHDDERFAPVMQDFRTDAEYQKQVLNTCSIISEIHLPKAVVGFYGPYEVMMPPSVIDYPFARRAWQLTNNAVARLLARQPVLFPTCYVPEGATIAHERTRFREFLRLADCKGTYPRENIIPYVSPMVAGKYTPLASGRFMSTLQMLKGFGIQQCICFGWIDNKILSDRWSFLVPEIERVMYSLNNPSLMQSAGAFISSIARAVIESPVGPPVPVERSPL